MSKTYADKLKDPRWQRVRLRVMERDGFKCRDCGDEKSTLHIHHCFYERGEPWDTKPRYLLTLCDSCHEKRQELEGDGKRMLATLFANLQTHEDDGGLKRFVTSLSNACSEIEEHEGEMSMPIVVDMHAKWQNAEERWIDYATNNPKATARDAVEAVLSREFQWPTIEQLSAVVRRKKT